MWNEVRQISDDAERVIKFVFSSADAVAEAVLYRYPTYEARTVICCSTMSGCPVGCRFCGAGDYFVRTLTADEIVGQVRHCIAHTEADPAAIKRLQIMFMSMGEPMLNQKTLVQAIRDLHGMYPTAALLISTSGPDVDYQPVIDVAKEISAVGLQFSVHESTDEKRDALIPFKKKLRIEQIAKTGVQFFRATGRSPFFNYCAHADNSSPEDADRLLSAFAPAVWQATVSVVCERSEGLAVSNEYQRGLAVDFSALLIERGYSVRVFDPAGQDTVGGGCGQLWFVQKWMRENPHLAKPSVGHGLGTIHAPLNRLTENLISAAMKVDQPAK